MRPKIISLTLVTPNKPLVYAKQSNISIFKELSEQELKNIIRQFGFPDNVKLFHIRGGFFNKKINCFSHKNKKYVIKKLHKKNQDESKYAIEYMKHLKENDIPIPLIKKADTNGTEVKDYYVKKEGAFFTIEKFCDGSDISYIEASENTFYKVGAFVALLHSKSKTFKPSQIPRFHWSFKQALNRDMTKAFEKMNDTDKEYITKNIEKLKSVSLDGLNKVTIHDLNFGNMKFDKNESPSAVFDFESARVGYRTEDIISTISHSGLPYAKSWNLDENTITKRIIPFVKGYNKKAIILGIPPFSKEELSLVPINYKFEFLYRINMQTKQYITEFKNADKIFSAKEWKTFLKTT